jgi:probable F420-dependent oxidoreductase
VRFGFPIPNCREGRDNLTGFVGAEEIVRLSQECERLGYDTVWANDFINPPRASIERFDPPPSWYEVFTSLCAVAVKTEKITLGVGLIVMPFREPVILAKQAITLDHFSNGRLLLGLGLGGSRDEFVSIKPKEARAHRGKMLDEGLEAVARLLSQTEASFEGEYYAYRDVSLYPRPVQSPIPIYISGHSETTPQRIAKYARGWLVSYPSLASFKEFWLHVEEVMEKEGRSMSELDVTTTWGMRLAKSREEALEQYKSSLQGKRARPEEWYLNNNLIGTPEQVAEFISGFQKAGSTHCSPIHVAGDTFQEIEEQMRIFAEEVIPLVKRG